MKNTLIFLALLATLLLSLASETDAAKKKGKKEQATEDPYAEIVWPPPPDEPRIKLHEIITSRADVEGESKFKKMLIGASPQSPYDRLKKPFAVEFDQQGRILVSDQQTHAVLRFDREEAKMDVFGTQTRPSLKLPLGLDAASNGLVYVADAALAKVLAFDESGRIQAVFGTEGELVNPTDAVLAPDGKRLFVSDSKEHKIVIFDAESGEILGEFGRRGESNGEFGFPTSLAFSPDGELFVVDQLNARVQVFDESGEYIDQFGGRGVGFANFVRPKDIAIDSDGLIYVSDNAFNNIQLFDADFTLLTFVGEGGGGPGQFLGASGVAANGTEIAVVDQLGARLQVLRFIASKTGE